MPAFYSVVRYVPDVVANERLNIGVLVFGDGRVRSQFLENWSRVRSFGAENIGFLKAFACDVAKMSEEDVRRISETWMHSIQLTQPAGSLFSPNDLLVDAAGRFLRQSESVGREYR